MRVILNLLKRPELLWYGVKISIIVRNVLRGGTPIYEFKGELGGETNE